MSNTSYFGTIQETALIVSKGNYRAFSSPLQMEWKTILCLHELKIWT